MIRVYTASKITTAPMWRDLHEEWPHVYFHARWLKHNKIGTPDLEEYASKFWIEDENDVRQADALIVYAKDGEHLRGALVEVGMALAFKVPVIVIGVHPDYGTWQHHPGVTRAGDKDHARAILEELDRKNGTHQGVTT